MSISYTKAKQKIMIMMMHSYFITKEILTGPLPWAWWHYYGDEVLLSWHLRDVTDIPWLLKQNTSRLGRSGECRLHRCSPLRVCRRNGECSEQWAGIVMTNQTTLRASLSGTFLQTLPDLVTPLKGHALFISAQLSTEAVTALRKVWVLIRLWKQHSVWAYT